MPKAKAKDVVWKCYGLSEPGIVMDSKDSRGVLRKLLSQNLIDAAHETVHFDEESRSVIFYVYKNKKKLSAAEVNALIAQLKD